MKKYLVTGVITISVSVEVEARSKREAFDKAAEMPMAGLCHQCGSQHAAEWSPSSLDGDVDMEEAEIQEL
jgi:hypothetical protein